MATWFQQLGQFMSTPELNCFVFETQNHGKISIEKRNGNFVVYPTKENVHKIPYYLRTTYRSSENLKQKLRGYIAKD